MSDVMPVASWTGKTPASRSRARSPADGQSAGRAGWSAGAHPVVLGVVRQLGHAECLHQRRDVHPEPAAVALAHAVPPADWVALRPAPGLDRSGRRLVLLVGC